MSRHTERVKQKILRQLAADPEPTPHRYSMSQFAVLEWLTDMGWVEYIPPGHNHEFGGGSTHRITQQGRAQITPAELIARRRQFLPNTWLPGWMVDPHRRCRHVNFRGIYGDEINDAGGKRARCLDCGRLLDHIPGRTP